MFEVCGNSLWIFCLLYKICGNEDESRYESSDTLWKTPNKLKRKKNPEKQCNEWTIYTSTHYTLCTYTVQLFWHIQLQVNWEINIWTRWSAWLKSFRLLTKFLGNWLYEFMNQPVKSVFWKNLRSERKGL